LQQKLEKLSAENISNGRPTMNQSASIFIPKNKIKPEALKDSNPKIDENKNLNDSDKKSLNELINLIKKDGLNDQLLKKFRLLDIVKKKPTHYVSEIDNRKSEKKELEQKGYHGGGRGRGGTIWQRGGAKPQAGRGGKFQEGRGGFQTNQFQPPPEP